MLRRELFLISIILVFLTCAIKADVIHSTWVGGEQGEWADASNWNPAIVPDNNDWRTFTVTIDSNSIGVEEVTVGLGQNREITQLEITQLDCQGTVRLENWSQQWVELTILEGLINHGDLEIAHDSPKINDEGAMMIIAEITNSGELELTKVWINGNVTNLADAELRLHGACISNNVYNPKDGTIEVNYLDGLETEVYGNLENCGVLRIGPHCFLGYYKSLHLNNTGQVQVNGGTYAANEFENDSNGVVAGFGIVYVRQYLQNKGAVFAFGGSLAVAGEGSEINTGTLGNMCLSTLYIRPEEDVNNQGNIVVNPGGGVAFDCNLVNETNATIQLNGGTLALNNSTITQQAGATLEGFGTISGSLILEDNAEIKFTASTNIIGNVEINENATLEINDGLTLITGQTTCNGTIHIKGGRIIPQGGLSGDCNILWEPGTYTNIADFNLDSRVNIEDFVAFADTWLWQAGW